MNIHELSKRIHENAVSKGFWEEYKALDQAIHNLGQYKIPETHSLVNLNKRFQLNAVAARLALIHSEVSEAVEALRVEDMVNFAEELADIVIRVMDLSAGLNIDLEDEIITKMAKNEDRQPMHGKLF